MYVWVYVRRIGGECSLSLIQYGVHLSTQSHTYTTSNSLCSLCSSSLPPSLLPSLLCPSVTHSRPPFLRPSSLTHARTNSRTHTTVYGKFYQGKLIVETDDMQWTYDVIGEHPHYDPPQVSRKVCMNDFKLSVRAHA